ncbi:hypothetical protein F2P56_007171 [Juglans regia]|uniref:Uncharacterized protein n=2 Tax=Juglans regia TaxID=51240 RepID=A0A833Y2R0_JUGRE|nr:CLAVATA3/ESR (CLE)-related protein TDIF-like [Juglans regia]KAF5475362.1 hypothetical protein F2P56_007171 [Juglans regia]
MATDNINVSPYLNFLAGLFFILLLISDTTVADMKHSFPPLTSFRDGAMKRNTMGFSSRKHGVGKSKTDSTCESVSTAIHDVRSSGPRRGRFQFQASRSPLPWQEKTFYAGEHEVPSGPNPISNR